MNDNENYVIGTDKVLVRTSSACMEGWERCDSIDALRTYASGPVKVEEGVKWTGAKLPAAMMKEVLGTIKNFPTNETAYVLYYNWVKKEWFIRCPEQRGRGGGVHFEDDGKGVDPGFSVIGSIHTHPEMSAFWSGTDMADQRGKYGLHIVFGLRGGIVNDNKCTIFTPSGHYDQKLFDVLEEVDFKEPGEPRKDWVEIIERGLKPVEPVRHIDIQEMARGTRRYAGGYFPEDVHRSHKTQAEHVKSKMTKKGRTAAAVCDLGLSDMYKKRVLFQAREMFPFPRQLNATQVKVLESYAEDAVRHIEAGDLDTWVAVLDSITMAARTVSRERAERVVNLLRGEEE